MRTAAAVVAFASVIVCSAAFSETEEIEPRLLYEIRDYPDTGFFQWISSISTDETGDTLAVLGGDPVGVSLYRRGSGSPLKQILFKAGPEGGDWGRAAACGGKILAARAGKVFEAAENGELTESAVTASEGAFKADILLCDRRGRLIMADRKTARIARFDAAGAPEMRIVKPEDAKLAARFPLKSLADVATDYFGRVYALDPKSRAAIPFDESGRPMTPISGSMFSDAPFPWDSPCVAADSRGRVWLVNEYEDSLDAYDSFGTPVARVARHSSVGPRFISPVQLIVDSEDRLYVLDAASVSVKVFDLR